MFKKTAKKSTKMKPAKTPPKVKETKTSKSRVDFELSDDELEMVSGGGGSHACWKCSAK